MQLFWFISQKFGAHYPFGVSLTALLPLYLAALILLASRSNAWKEAGQVLLILMALTGLLAVTAELFAISLGDLIQGAGMVIVAALSALRIFIYNPEAGYLAALLADQTTHPQAIFLLDENNRIAAVSNQAEKILQVKTGALNRRPWQSVSADYLKRPVVSSATANELDIWEIHDRYYQLQVNPAEYPASQKRQIIQLLDCTESYEHQRVIDDLDHLLQDVNTLPGILTATTSLQDGLEQCLKRIGKTTRASRVYLMENGRNTTGSRTMSLFAEWCADGIPARIQESKMQGIPYVLSRFGDWEKPLSERQTVQQQFVAGEIPGDDTLLAANCRTLLLAPVFSGHEWWGILGFENYSQPIHRSESEQHLLQAAADHLGAALQTYNWENRLLLRSETEVKERTNELLLTNSRLELELKRRELAEELVEKKAQQLIALHEASNALLVTLELEPLLGRILDAAMSAIPSAEKGTLHMIAKDTGQLEMRAVLGFSDTRIRRLYGQDKRGVLARAVQEKRSILVNDTRDLGELMPVTEAFETETVRSLIVSPLNADQEILGALSLAASAPDSFDENDLQVLSSFATTATLALRNAQLHAAVQKMAITDSLTQIYNRRGFMEIGERLFESARRFRHPLTAIALDLDYFKEVNDKFGHNTGDLALQFFAELMLRSLRKVDLVGRMGGDEFAILLPETDIFHAVQVGERIRKKTELSAFPSSHGPIKVTVSLGIAKLSTQTAELDELLNRADKALYESKHSGRNRARMFPLESRMPDLIPPGPG